MFAVYTKDMDGEQAFQTFADEVPAIYCMYAMIDMGWTAEVMFSDDGILWSRW